MSGIQKGLTRQQMADRIALEFQDGWIVNLGVGIPTMCSNTDIGDRDITYHSENGVIGYGRIAPAGEEDLNLVNAGGQNVTLKAGAAVVHHAELVRNHPRRPHRRHRHGRLRGRVQRRLCQLENHRTEGRRHRRRDGSRGVCEACVHHHGTDHAQRCTAAGCAMRAAGDGARHGEAGGDELRPVRARRRRVPHSRNRTRHHAGRSARDRRLQADSARQSAGGCQLEESHQLEMLLVSLRLPTLRTSAGSR